MMDIHFACTVRDLRRDKSASGNSNKNEDMPNKELA